MRGGRAILALLALIIVVDAAIFPAVARRMGEAAGRTSFLPLDLRFLYSADEAYAALQSLGSGGRRLYTIVELTVDVVYPLIYALFLFLLVRWLLAKAGPAPLWAERATKLPFAAMSLDWLENIAIVAMILRFPQRSDTIAALASGTTTLKLICFVLSVALVLYAAGRFTVRRRQVRPL